MNDDGDAKNQENRLSRTLSEKTRHIGYVNVGGKKFRFRVNTSCFLKLFNV